ncbi:hypothetical protein MKY48_05470 [Paenibacillus sp. FSL W8-0187]|uniref:hypothetical protein n=1 Tax=Paenibacillus sp. FSL W8-0187 TaxID=2921710 RepID=UPI0030D9505A
MKIGTKKAIQVVLKTEEKLWKNEGEGFNKKTEEKQECIPEFRPACNTTLGFNTTLSALR